MYHPCQALGDLLTIRDLLGGFKGRKITITWAYHPRPLPMSVTHSVLLAACTMGMAVTLSHPLRGRAAPKGTKKIRLTEIA